MTQNLRGAGLMTLSMVTFAINDACIKYIGDVLPIFQTMFLRSVMTTTLLGIMLWLSGWRFEKRPRRENLLMILRVLSEIGAAYFIISALFNMELANITALLQLLPLTVPLAVWLFLGEPMGWQRMTAIGVGFLGMLLIVQPGSAGFNIYSLYGLAAVGCVTIRDITARQIGAQVSSTAMAFFAALAVTVFSGIGSGFETWQPVTPWVWMILCGSALAILLGYVVAVQVMRTGDVSFTAQFRYTGLIAALILGFVFFDEWPNGLTIMGALIVVASGLFTIYRERRLQKTQ